MAKIGSELQEIRLKKGLTLDRIADDTNISVRFLSKIENDDFSGFPGEPYVVGFIRNYADYLGLDAEKVLAAYRRKDPEPVAAESTATEAGEPVAQPPAEAPPPSSGSDAQAPAGLPAPKSRQGFKGPRAAPAPTPTPTPTSAPASVKALSPRIVLIAGSAAAVVILVLALWIIVGGKSSGMADAPPVQNVEYRVESGPFDKRIYPGDSVLVPLGSDVYKIRLAAIDDTVRLETPFGPYSIALGGTGIIDPDGDGQPDISLIVSDFQKNKPKSGALLRIEFSPAAAESAQAGEIMVPENPAQTPGPAGSPILGGKPDIVVTRSTRGPYPFVLQATFRGNCLFRYETDRKDWVEKYYSKGESITINVNSSVTVWASNAQAAKLSFQASGGRSVDIELGAPGEIAVKRFSWSNSSGTWTLVASELD